MKSIIIGCWMSIISAGVVICPDSILIEKNKIWSSEWCEALIIRNKELTKKYGIEWYKADVYKTIPKQELETELMKKLREKK